MRTQTDTAWLQSCLFRMSSIQRLKVRARLPPAARLGKQRQYHSARPVDCKNKACISFLCQASFFNSLVAGKNLHIEWSYETLPFTPDFAYAPTLVELVGVLLP